MSDPCRILVTDDYPDAADVLAAVLGLAGYQVRTAYTGAQALDVVLAWRPAAVLLDVSLPDISGYDVARRICAELGADRPLLAAVTGWGAERDRRSALDAGFDRHFTKPVEADALAEWLAAALGARCGQSSGSTVVR